MAPPPSTGVPEPRDAAVDATVSTVDEAVRVVATWQPAWDRHGPAVLDGLRAAGRRVDPDAIALLLAWLGRADDVPFDPLAALLFVGLHGATRRERALVAVVLIGHGIDGERARRAAGLHDTAHLPLRRASTFRHPLESTEPSDLCLLLPAVARHLVTLHGGAQARAALPVAPPVARPNAPQPSRGSSTTMHAGRRHRRRGRRIFMTVCALMVGALTGGGAALTWSVRSRNRFETALLIPPASVPIPWVLTSATARHPLFVRETSPIEQSFVDGERSIRLVIDVSTRVYEDVALGEARSA